MLSKDYKVETLHFGDHKSRSKGTRPNQKVYANQCMFRVCTFQPKEDKFKIEFCENRHIRPPNPEEPNEVIYIILVPHEILAEHYALYGRKMHVFLCNLTILLLFFIGIPFL